MSNPPWCGAAVPERISPLGFGEFEIGREMVPPLSTIGVDLEHLGRGAGQVILDLPCDGATGGERPADVGFTLSAPALTL